MQPQSDMPPANEGSVLSAIISLILGAVLGVAVSKLVEDTASLLVASVSSAAIVASAVLAFVSIALARRQNVRIANLVGEMRAVGRQVGEPADLTFERFEKSTGEYFRRLHHAIEQLKPGDHVYVMTHHMRPVNDDAERNETHSKARMAYLNALLKKAREGVIYRRIMCFEPTDGDAPFKRDFVRQHIKEHCLGMLDVALSRPGDVVVKKAPALLMADIFIINHELGAISMETYAPDSPRLYTAGALIVHDPPNGRIIDQLRAWWDEAYANSTVVRKADLLPEPPVQAAG